MLLRHLVALSLITASSTALADSFDINLRDTSAQLQYSAALGSSTLGKNEMHLGYLYTSKTNSYADFGILVKDEVSPNAPGLTVGVGLKGLLAKVNTNTASALALGGQVRYAAPAVPRIGFSASAYWSPNILTFGDADRTVETGARLEYEVIPQATAYIGYRKINVGLKNAGQAKLEEGAHIGVRLSF
jgi:predicted enzyme related to lactoylglutathione lyase